MLNEMLFDHVNFLNNIPLTSLHYLNFTMAEDLSNVLNRQNIDISIEESGSISCYMDGIVENLCVIKGKLDLFVGNSCMMCILWTFPD